MRKEIDLSIYFKMDKTIVHTFNSFEEAEKENAFWLKQPVEQRYYTVEFLRAQ